MTTTPWTGSLSDRALHEHGLLGMVERRARGERLDEKELSPLSACDLLVLGAAADRVRTADVGAEVRVHPSAVPGIGRLVAPGADGDTGTVFLRAVARARIEGEPGCRIVVDAASVGVPVAVVALAFGASDLIVHPTRRSLTSLETSAPEQERAELQGRITRAGRTARFIDSASPNPHPSSSP